MEIDSDNTKVEEEEEELGGALSPGSKKYAWTNSTSKILFNVAICQPDLANISWEAVVAPGVAKVIGRGGPHPTGRQCRCAIQSISNSIDLSYAFRLFGKISFSFLLARTPATLTHA